MEEWRQMSLDDLLQNKRERDGYKIVARVIVGNKAYERDFSWSQARHSYRFFFPCMIDGSTGNLPIKEYEDWADYEFEYF
jgi:hypothetical protein